MVARKSYCIVGFLFVLNLFSWHAVYNPQPQLLEIVFFDVGQGDSALIKNGKYQILIDGGPGSGILEKLGREMPFYDRDIDLVILTHPEHDHIAGLIEVLERYEVDNVLWTGIVKNTDEYARWIEVIGDSNVRIAEAGTTITVPGLYMEVIHPFESLEGREFEDANNTSVVVKLVFQNNCVVFAGDIYNSVERQIIDKGFDVDCEVLKIAHHGSKTSTSREFTEAVSPDFAVISSGKDNSYGHPHEQVLEILNEYGISVLRTDESGDIEVVSDGNNLVINNF